MIIFCARETGPSAGTIVRSHSLHTRARSFSRLSLRDYCEAKNLLPEEQCGFRRYRSTTDMMFVVRRLQDLGGKACVPLFLCFIDMQKAHDSVDRSLLWQVLARFGVMESLWAEMSLLREC